MCVKAIANNWSLYIYTYTWEKDRLDAFETTILIAIRHKILKQTES